jgi:hypothetical protein
VNGGRARLEKVPQEARRSYQAASDSAERSSRTGTAVPINSSETSTRPASFECADKIGQRSA